MANEKQITVQGVEVTVNQPYAPGHTLNEAEAKALNQVRAENIGNNVRAAITKLMKDAGVEAPTDEIKTKAQELVTAKDAEYVFTLHNVSAGRKSQTPLEAECTRLARDYVNGKIKDKGLTIKAWKESKGDNADEQYAELIAQVAENEEIVRVAKANLKQKEKLASIEIG